MQLLLGALGRVELDRQRHELEQHDDGEQDDRRLGEARRSGAKTPIMSRMNQAFEANATAGKIALRT